MEASRVPLRPGPVDRVITEASFITPIRERRPPPEVYGLHSGGGGFAAADMGWHRLAVQLAGLLPLRQFVRGFFAKRIGIPLFESIW
jgi:hypothetical protein